VRYIFVDEAGTSALEPVTVVVGIIADADKDVMNAEAMVREIIGAVPPQHRTGFVFHATQVFNDRRYQADWAMTDRLHLLNQMMSVPRRVGMAITLSVVWRKPGRFVDVAPSVGLTESQFDHLIAFGNCLAMSDRNIRRKAGPTEVAAVVAEDVPEMRKFLRMVPRIFRDNPLHLPPSMLRTTLRDAEAGYSTQSGELRIARIRNAIHFVEKADDPLVQVADACAYGFRRYFAGEKFGIDFTNSILGDSKLLRDFAEPSGMECWWPEASINP
jgi:Protein of unknown function (DUF3800)